MARSSRADLLVECLESRDCPSGSYLYVADYDKHSVLKFDAQSGELVDVVVRNHSGGLHEPLYPILSPHDGNLYVGDRAGGFQNRLGGRILRFNGATGAYMDEFVTTGSGGIVHPFGMAFAPRPGDPRTLDLYVCNLGDKDHAGNVLHYTSAFASIDIRIADLGGTTLGMASGNTIWLDANAAGWGWFVDRGTREAGRPGDDAEFTTPGDPSPRLFGGWIASCIAPARSVINTLMRKLSMLCVLLLLARPAVAQEKSVNPGINKQFENPQVEEFIGRFERDGRDPYDHRHEILQALALQPGMTVADVGAGTGLFTRLFAPRVGPEGKVYAVDIAENFVKHIERQARADGLTNIKGVVCAADSVNLPPQSIDLAFICDTYHHFEFPHKTMRSIHRALKPGGCVVLIDFHRIEGVSSPWVLSHVRAGQEVFTKEILDAGFRQVEERKGMLRESYYVRFEKVEDGKGERGTKDQTPRTNDQSELKRP